MGTGAVAGATIGAGVLSAGASLYGSSQSSKASSAAAQAQLAMYEQTANNLQPFRGYGQVALGGAGGALQSALATPAGAPYLAQANQFQQTAAQNMPPSVVTEGWLQQTPGYQWQLGQGLKATQAAAAARGLGVSGASLKGAATYATGLADANYQNQFSNAQTTWKDFMDQATGQMNLASTANTQQQNQITNLTNIGNIGEAAAAQTATAGTQAASSYGNYLNQSGQAQAAGTTGAANALTSSVNNYLSYNALTQAIQAGQGTYDFSAGPGATSGR